MQWHYNVARRWSVGGFRYKEWEHWLEFYGFIDGCRDGSDEWMENALLCSVKTMFCRALRGGAEWGHEMRIVNVQIEHAKAEYSMHPPSVFLHVRRT